MPTQPVLLVKTWILKDQNITACDKLNPSWPIYIWSTTAEYYGSRIVFTDFIIYLEGGIKHGRHTTKEYLL
jgi:hypothetical protein